MHHLQTQVSGISSVPLVLANRIALGSVLRLGVGGGRRHTELLRVTFVLPDHSFEFRVVIVHRFAIRGPLFLNLCGCLVVQLSGVVDEPSGDLERSKNAHKGL